MKITLFKKIPLFLILIIQSGSSSTAAPKIDADVMIIGAGLAGLSTAYHLKKAGLTYKIIELTPHIGGRMRTASYPEKLSAEVGLEEFWDGNPTLEIAKELKIPMEKAAGSFSSFFYQGKHYPYSQNTNDEFLKSIFTDTEIATFKKWDQKMLVLYEQTKKRPLSKELLKLKDISFGAWVKKDSKLSKKMQEFVRIESEPEYATSWNSISALDGILEWHIFAATGTNSYHTEGGNQVLGEKIADHLGRKNIILNTKATGITSDEHGVTVTAVDQGNYQHHSYRGKYVVTTQPLFRLFEMQFMPPLSEQKKMAIMSQTWGSYFTAHVILDKAAAKFWTVSGENILPILSDSPLGVIYGDFDLKDKNENVLLNLLVTGPDAEKFNLRAVMAMDSVRHELTAEFEKKWPGSSKLIKKFEFYQYHPRAIASWPVGRSRLDDQSEALRTPQGRIYLAGDFTEGTHSDGAAHSAVRVSSEIIQKEKK
jgi:monoamine oxidase